MPDITFKISSSTEYLVFLREVVSSLGLGGETARRVGLSLVEAVDNAIFHAHKRDPNKEINIRIKSNSDKIMIDVTDEGDGFDINKIPVPAIDQINGRGIFIIKSFMKNVSYRNNRLRMVYEK